MKIIAPKQDANNFKLPKPGTHQAQLVEYEDLGYQTNPYNGKEQQRAKLVFELEDGLKQYHWVNTSLHPSAKFYELATALLGRNPSSVLEMDDLIGLYCEITIEHYVDSKKNLRSKIVDFRGQQ